MYYYYLKQGLKAKNQFLTNLAAHMSESHPGEDNDPSENLQIRGKGPPKVTPRLTPKQPRKKSNLKKLGKDRLLGALRIKDQFQKKGTVAYGQLFDSKLRNGKVEDCTSKTDSFVYFDKSSGISTSISTLSDSNSSDYPSSEDTVDILKCKDCGRILSKAYKTTKRKCLCQMKKEREKDDAEQLLTDEEASVLIVSAGSESELDFSEEHN